ncbi:MAG: TMEM165/GDT1 family protein [Cyanobium sp.]|jgi:putative Ca2+/H+ antiporter (TMEM165/GDT1 family)
MSLPQPHGSSPEPPESSEVLSQDPTASQPAVAAPAPAAALGAASWLSVFLSTATTVFLAELGDKTQLAALLLSAESGRPGVVFLGASLALICSSLVGVVLGRWLSTVMAPEQLERAAGVLMVALGLWLGRQAVLHLAPLPAAAVAALGT